MKTILIVEDDAFGRECVLEMLKMQGFEVAYAKDSVEARGLIECTSFDVALVDLLLSESDGLKIIPEIRALSPNTALIAMSGGGPFPSEQLLKLARYFGADGALEKPFTPEQLAMAMDASYSRDIGGLVQNPCQSQGR
jgi:DNA-binding response OmpR family regulator